MAYDLASIVVIFDKYISTNFKLVIRWHDIFDWKTPDKQSPLARDFDEEAFSEGFF